MRRGKYGNKRTNGYASKREANHGANLLALEQSKLVFGLATQVPFDLLPKCEGYARPLRYIADFVYKDTAGIRHVEDVKGFQTQVYIIKKRLMKQLLGIEIEEV